MAEILLSKQARMRLARVLDGKMCPSDLDRSTYKALQCGEHGAVSLRNFSSILQAHGNIVIQAIPGIKR